MKIATNVSNVHFSQIHGHAASGDCLFDSLDTMSTWRGESAEKCLETFCRKRDALLAHPSVNFVEVTWECQFTENLRCDPAMSQFFENKIVHPGNKMDS